MSSDFEDKVADAIATTIEEFHRKAQELKETHSIPAEELFPPAFMQEHTAFETIEEFLVAGDFDPERDGEWDALADQGLDRHVRKTTDFEAWEEMKETASEEWILAQLKS